MKYANGNISKHTSATESLKDVSCSQNRLGAPFEDSDAYRRVAASLAASAWGGEHEENPLPPGSFRNMGELDHIDQCSGGVLSAFQKCEEQASTEISNGLKRLGNDDGVGMAPNKQKDSIFKNMIFSVEKTYARISSNKREEETTSQQRMLIDNSKSDVSPFNESKLSLSKNVSSKIIHSQFENPEDEESLDIQRHAHSRYYKPHNLNDLHSIGCSTKKNHSRTCLTTPSEPAFNNGMDNSDTNLILYVNDIITVAESPENDVSCKRNMLKLEVIELLGQGTYAQVVKCKNTKTNELIALKIYKNKPAYTKQAEIEIEIFEKLARTPNINSKAKDRQKISTDQLGAHHSIAKLLYYFTYHSHLCLAFNLLGLNLYEVLKKDQFRGLPIRMVRSLMKQAIEGVHILGQHNIVHCDLKPENILLLRTNETSINEKISNSNNSGKDGNVSGHANDLGYDDYIIKLIDFGSACVEGHIGHTYIQSRFYRSPEVLVGVPYDSAIDMWSLGCVAAELFLGLPILPGIDEFDQLYRIDEMIAPIPTWMIEQGSKSNKYFSVNRQQSPLTEVKEGSISMLKENDKMHWRLKSRKEYLESESQKDKGNIANAEQRPNRYFRRVKLSDIISERGQCFSKKDESILRYFIHFLQGLLHPDPWKRLTAYQAKTHPFITGKIPDSHLIVWEPKWDPSICQRKLLNVQKAREIRKMKKHATDLDDEEKSRKTGLSHIKIDEELNSGDDSKKNTSGTRLRRMAGVQPEFSRTSKLTTMTKSISLSDELSVKNSTSTIGSGSTNLSPFESSVGFTNAQNTSELQYNNVGSLPNHYLVKGTGGSYSLQENGHFVVPSAPNQLHADDNLWVDATGRPYSYHAHHLPMSNEAQAVPHIYYDRSDHVRVQGDLGTALQRPGVVPNMVLNAVPSHLSPQQGMSYQMHQQLPKNHSKHNESLQRKNMEKINNKMKQMGDCKNGRHAKHSQPTSSEKIVEGKSLLAQQLDQHSSSEHKSAEKFTNEHHHQSPHFHLHHNHQSMNQRYTMQTAYSYNQTAAYGNTSRSLGSYVTSQQANYFGMPPPSNVPPLILSTTPTLPDPRLGPYYTHVVDATGSYGSLYGMQHPPSHPAGGSSFPMHMQNHLAPVDPQSSSATFHTNEFAYRSRLSDENDNRNYQMHHHYPPPYYPPPYSHHNGNGM